MCTLELEMACLDHKNTPVDPDPFSSLFIFPHVPSFSTPCHRAQGALLNAAIQQAQGIHGHLCVAFGLQQSQLCQERPAASKTHFHGGPEEKAGAACPQTHGDFIFENKPIELI